MAGKQNWGYNAVNSIGRRVLDGKYPQLFESTRVFDSKTRDFGDFLNGRKFFEKAPPFSGAKTSISIKIDTTLCKKFEKVKKFFIPSGTTT